MDQNSFAEILTQIYRKDTTLPYVYSADECFEFVAWDSDSEYFYFALWMPDEDGAYLYMDKTKPMSYAHGIRKILECGADSDKVSVMASVLSSHGP